MADPRSFRRRATRAILCGMLVVGAFDIIHARIYYEAPFAACFRGVAAGLLGRSAFSRGLPAALLGALLHFFIAFVVVSTYYQAAKREPALARRPLLWGPLYGIAVFAFMNYLVVPLSAAGSFDELPTSLVFILNFAIGHALGVGLPSALAARAAIGAHSGSGSRLPGSGPHA